MLYCLHCWPGLCYFSVQDRSRENSLIHLETVLFPEAKVLEFSSEMAKKPTVYLDFFLKAYISSFTSGLLDFHLFVYRSHHAILKIMLGMKNVESGSV